LQKHQLKTSFFKILDRLPSSLGYAIYHAVQERMTGSFAAKFEANSKSFHALVKMLNESGLDFTNKNILEIGSGWMPLMPYHLKVDGKCASVFTYDINDHYNNKYIDELNAQYAKDGKLNFDVSSESLHVPTFIEYHPFSNVITADLPEKVDIIFSRFVLEHVTPEDLLAMHVRFSEKYGNEVIILHLISPSDHRAFSDSSLSHYDFLQYSEEEWNRIQTKFDYHNRLRLPQYLSIFEKAGMQLIHLEHDKAELGSKKYELFKKVKLHHDYKKYSEEELTAGSINVLLRPKEK